MSKGMFSLVMKNLFDKPVTRDFPKVERKPFERNRGRIKFDDTNCLYCGMCQRKCPADAITVDRKTKTWQLNAFRCIICGECTHACPKKCITMTNERRHSATEKPIVKVKKEEQADA